MNKKHRDTLNRAFEIDTSRLDISPTMFQEATDHYRAITSLLCSHGLEADIMPYGSFGTGTVVRPSIPEGAGSFYDLDVLCVCSGIESSETTQESLREQVDGTIEGDERYASMVEGSKHMCLTLSYAESKSRPAFKMDLSTGLSSPTPYADGKAHTEESVKLAWIKPDEWKASNPKGLCQWFNDENLRFRAFGLAERKRRIFEKHRGFYASVEKVPDDMDRSALQRAVQVVKRSRDVFFARAKRADDAPSSCVLMVLVATFAKSLPASADIVTILDSFVEGCLAMRDISGSARIEVPNPAFDEDLAAGWSPKRVEGFFLWIEDLAENTHVDYGVLASRNAAYDAIMGKGSSRGLENEGVFAPAPPTAIIERPVKPWRPRAWK